MPFFFSFSMLGSLVVGEPKLPLISDCRQSDVVLLISLRASSQSDIPVRPPGNVAGGHAPRISYSVVYTLFHVRNARCNVLIAIVHRVGVEAKSAGR